MQCSSTSPCIEEEIATPILGHISPALTADEPSDSALPINFPQLELFGSNSTFGDGANSMFFMDDLFQDVINGNIANDTTNICTTPPSTVSQEPMEQLFIDSTTSSGASSVVSMEEAEYILLDAQGQLLHLVRALSQCSSFPQDVEEIYRITDSFVKVVDDIATGLDASSTRTSWCNSSITHMLLSSCYMSLIQAFECLVRLSRRELAPTGDGLEPTLGISLAQTRMCIPTTASNVPYIGTENVRLAMPHRAVTEINLHLAGQAVQHLKASISRCSAKVQPGLGMENKLSMHALDSSSAICAFMKLAMNELEQRENSLLSGLQMPTL